MESVITLIRNELWEKSNESIRNSSQHFFKEPVKIYGLKTADVNAIGKRYFRDLKELPKQEIFELCEELWKSGFQEEAIISCQWTEKLASQFTVDDLPVFEKWINTYVSNWAQCDTFCNHTVGNFFFKFPQQIRQLKTWSISDNRWMRRASSVSLIIPARRGLFLEEIFEIAELLLTDSDDLVQKGYGWMLKASSETYPQEVFNFVKQHKKKMPRTALRYAIEKLSEEWKKEAMKK
jgi:3-methyladenine DNA glycosylase AlkD